MPFRSVEQREFLKRVHPDIYKRWVREHGTKIVPSKKKKKRKPRKRKK